MPDIDPVFLLKEGKVKKWNRWRRDHPRARPDLTDVTFFNRRLHGANLANITLTNADLSGANLEKADLRSSVLDEAVLFRADLYNASCQGASLRNTHLGSAHLPNCHLEKADLRGAELTSADLSWANLTGADLRGANLAGANLSKCNLDHADLRKSILESAILVQATMRGADLRGADVYGISVWNVITDKKTKATGLFTDFVPASRTRVPLTGVTVDDLRVAHFISQLEEPEIISKIIDASSNRLVLLLGRLSGPGRAILMALKQRLREFDLLAIAFDFPPPDERDTTETIKVLATLSRFVIADVSHPKSVPLELQAIAPHVMVPIVPIMRSKSSGFSMLVDLQRKYHWVLSPVVYKSKAKLIENVERGIIERANSQRASIRRKSRQARASPRRISDY